jgi:hypothetical protein
MPITKFEVVEPPTGGEVVDRALVALGHGDILTMVIKATEQQVPTPEEQEIAFHIRRTTTHPNEGGMTITGYTESPRQLVRVCIEDNNQAANGSLITA